MEGRKILIMKNDVQIRVWWMVIWIQCNSLLLNMQNQFQVCRYLHKRNMISLIASYSLELHHIVSSRWTVSVGYITNINPCLGSMPVASFPLLPSKLLSFTKHILIIVLGHEWIWASYSEWCVLCVLYSNNVSCNRRNETLGLCLLWVGEWKQSGISPRR